MNYQDYMEHNHDGCFRGTVPEKITKLLDNYDYTFQTYVNGRNLSDAINLHYGNGSFGYLFKLINYVASKFIIINPQYHTFSTGDSPRNLNDVVSTYVRYNSRNPERRTFQLNIVHVPRGTTFVATTLETAERAEEITRLKHIELQLIMGTTHYIKVFKHNTITDSDQITIITNWVDKSLIHKILLFVPILMNWDILSDEELAVIAKNSPEEYADTFIRNHIPALFAKLFDLYGGTIDSNAVTEYFTQFWNEIIKLKELDNVQTRSFIDNLTSAVNNKIISNTKREYDDTKQNIKHYEERLADYYAKKEVLEKRMLLQAYAGVDDVTALINGINNNKHIKVLDADDYTMLLSITAPLQFFTSSDFECYERESRSYFNTHTYGSNRTYTDPIFHKIFVTHEYKLLLSAVIELRVDNSSYSTTSLSVNARTIHNTGVKDKLDSVPNPHLYFYNCWSKSQTMIQKATVEKNYDLIPILMLNSVQTINVAETQSFHKLLNLLEQESWRNKVKIITKDGTEINWDKAVEIEKENYKTMVTPIDQSEETTEPKTVEGYTQIVVEDEEPINTDNL